MTAAVSRLATLDLRIRGHDSSAGMEGADDAVVDVEGLEEERRWKGEREERVRERGRWIVDVEFEVEVVDEDFVDEEQDDVEAVEGAATLLGT